MSARHRSTTVLTLAYTITCTLLSLADASSQSNQETAITHAIGSSQLRSSYQPIENDNDDVMLQYLHQSDSSGRGLDQLLRPEESRLVISPSLEEEKRAFKFGKRSEESGNDVMTENKNKKAFKFGKRSDFMDADAAEVDKRAFKFGKKSNFADTESDEPEKRAFKFGKKSEFSAADREEMEKRAFKFGKRWPESYAYSAMDDKRGGFKFGKRSSLGNAEEIYQEVEDKRAFKFGKRPDRMFKFGKRSAEYFPEPHDDIHGDWATKLDTSDFVFSRQSPLYENLEYAEQDSGPTGDKRAFKFGKRVIMDLDNPGISQYRDAEALRELWGPGEGLSQSLGDVDDKRAFKFGKRPQVSSRQQQQKELKKQIDSEVAERRRFLFKLGKRSMEQQELRDLQELKRQFKFGK